MFTDQFLPFLLTALLIELTPGPNMAWLALTGASVGKRAALYATAGIALGLAIMAVATALGLAELSRAFPNLIGLLRYAGAGYLLWLALEAWTGKGDVSPSDMQGGDSLRWFRHGLVVNLLNPKAALFFVAILPNYVDAAMPTLWQTLLLSTIYVLVATLVHLMIASLSDHAHAWFQQGRNAVIARRICAVLIAAVALWFFVSAAN